MNGSSRIEAVILHFLSMNNKKKRGGSAKRSEFIMAAASAVHR